MSSRITFSSEDQLPIDCTGATLTTDEKVILEDMGGDKVIFTGAKLEAAQGITIKEAPGGKFEDASLLTTDDHAWISFFSHAYDWYYADLTNANFNGASIATAGDFTTVDFH